MSLFNQITGARTEEPAPEQEPKTTPPTQEEIYAATKAEDKLGLFAMQRKENKKSQQKQAAFQAAENLKQIRNQQKANKLGQEPPLKFKDWERIRMDDPSFYYSEAGTTLRDLNKQELGIIYRSPN